MTDINLALNKPTNASSYVKPYEPSRAVNGNYSAPTSRWLGKAPGWIAVDLGQKYDVYKWCVRHMPCAGWMAPDYVMGDFTLQGSNDGENWVNIDSVTNNSLAVTLRAINVVNFRYFRVYVYKGLRINNQLASIVEFEIYKAPKSSRLSSLTASSGALTPAFSKEILNYSAPSVAYETSQMSVTATAEDVEAGIKINNQTAITGKPYTVNLNYGKNTIEVVVNASDGSNKSLYKIDTFRTSPYLTGLTLSSGTLSPTFTQNTYNYIASVGNEVGSITVTPIAQDTSATITVNGAVVSSGQPSGAITLNEGANTISIVVTPTIGAGKTYTLTVYRKSTIYLNSLIIRNGTVNVPIDPVFDGAILDYIATVSSSAVNVTLSPTLPTGVSAKMTINGISVTSGGRVNVDISSGVNTISIVLTSTTAPVKTNTYTIKITKP